MKRTRIVGESLAAMPVILYHAARRHPVGGAPSRAAPVLPPPAKGPPIMCGIVAAYGPNPGRRLSEALGAIRHRGPDSEGIQEGRGWAMGIRRLAIIDVAGGDQPIANEDESIWVVCNGEIYNHNALRRDLVARGH